MNMLNINKVNAESSYFLHATFCVIFCDSGRILDSRNPVKYSRNLRINLKKALKLKLIPLLFSLLSMPYWVPPRLKPSVSRICYIESKSKRASRQANGAWALSDA
jgi:hypothetical protein